MDLVAWEPNMDSENTINITRTIYVTFAMDTSFDASAITYCSVSERVQQIIVVQSVSSYAMMIKGSVRPAF